ncbi:MAG: DUF6807 family protein [Pirellulaceae bacterium]
MDRTTPYWVLLTLGQFVQATAGWCDEPLRIAFTVRDDRLEITAGTAPVATYVFRDPVIPRPYFAHLFAPGGLQVSRHHPPRPGVDATDHDKFHPGLWMAFGDLSGHDSWRLKAAVRHVEFVTPPTGGPGRGTFGVVDRYCENEREDEEICRATSHYTIVARPHGYLILLDTVFTSPAGKEFAFGDQEEMGVGIRVATPLAVKQGGRMLDSEGRLNESQIWGKAAPWCDYSGRLNDHEAGILLMAAPDQFRVTRWHARDYGFLAANAFGNRVFKLGEAQRTAVAANHSLQLRYGVLLHATPVGMPLDLAAEFAAYVQELSQRPAAGRTRAD